MAKTILIIEDDKSIQNILREFLTANGYLIEVANDGVEGIEKFRWNNPDLILLDIMLPKVDGYAVCEIIRQESNVPIIMVTAKNDSFSQMKGFECLADDYITKPFSLPLVVCRIEAVLRRANEKINVEKSRNKLTYGNLILYLEGQEVLVEGREVILTVREYEILKLLMENPEKIFSRENLLCSIWGYEYYGDQKILNTHICNIRKKLGEEYIETIRGRGYRLGRR